MSARDIEVLSAMTLRAAAAMGEDLKQLMVYLPPSKRSSNVQRMLDQMAVRAAAIDEFRGEISSAPEADRLALASELVAAAGLAVGDKAVLQEALMVLCAARDGQMWDSNFLKDFDAAIEGLRAILAAVAPLIRAAALEATAGVLAEDGHHIAADAIRDLTEPKP